MVLFVCQFDPVGEFGNVSVLDLTLSGVEELTLQGLTAI